MRRTIGRIGGDAGLLVAFVGLSLLFRGHQLTTLSYLNPDEAELMVNARAALLSPTPFSTWMTSTIGPVWVLFLAGLGVLGLPLTIGSAHLIAAVMYGLLGFGVFVLLRRSFGFLPGFTLSLVWWLPLALAVPLGTQSDFGAMTTELLPAGLVLGAALIPRTSLERRPWLLGVVGALCSLAVFAKYQTAPVAIGLLAFYLISSGQPWRTWLRPALWWVAGAVAPILILILVTVLSPTFSFELVLQNYRFLAAYGHSDLRARVVYTAMILGAAYTVGSVIAIATMAFLSRRRDLLARTVLVASGFASVVMGGNPYGHYLMYLFVAIAIAASLPLHSHASLVLTTRRRLAASAMLIVLALGLAVYTTVTASIQLARPQDVAAALSPDSVLRDDDLAAVCEPGSAAIVWGWAPQIYLDNDLRNAIPFIGSVQITNAPANQESGEEIVGDAIRDEDTKCVIDAIGDEYFPAISLTEVFPSLRDDLDSLYRVGEVIDCSECTVYVRR